MGLWRSTANMLASAVLCAGVFCTIPAENLKRQRYNELFKPFIACILLGMSSSVAAISFYVFWRSRQATLEAEDKEKSHKTKRMKRWLLILGVMCALLALVLRVGLNSSEERRHLFVVACIEVVVPFVLLDFDTVDTVADMLT